MSGFKFLFGNFWEVSLEKLRVQLLCVLFVFGILIFLISNLGFENVLLFLSLCLSCCGLYYLKSKQDVVEKYGLESRNGFYSLSYQSYDLILLALSPGVIFASVSFAISWGNLFFFPLGLGCFLIASFFGPYLRRNTFNDNSAVIDKNDFSLNNNDSLEMNNSGKLDEKEGNKFNDKSGSSVSLEIGYSPFLYSLLLMFIGFYGFITLIFTLGQFSNLELKIYSTVVFLVYMVLSQILVLFPDKLNKISPIDLRTNKGCLLFLGLNFIIFFGVMFNLTNIVCFVFNTSISSYFWIVGFWNDVSLGFIGFILFAILITHLKLFKKIH